MPEITETTYPTLDRDRALELLREIVAERPDYVYPRVMTLSPSGAEINRCYYEQNGEPSCIVGHVLVRAGYPIEFLRSLDNSGLVPEQGVSAIGIFANSDGAVDMKTAWMLRKAQVAQDLGNPWSAALAAAEKDYLENPDD